MLAIGQAAIKLTEIEHKKQKNVIEFKQKKDDESNSE
jgi:hypothetical protein